MMTQQLEVSILAAPLAAIDRRALSQAWYTALRYAKGGAQRPYAARRQASVVRMGVCGRTGRAAEQASRPGAPSASARFGAVRGPGSPADGWGGTSLRIAGRTSLAQRIESAFSDPKSKLRRATFSLGRGNVRVHVILQSNGDRMVLLALCPPEVRTVVSKALAQARLTLAARGVGVSLEARGGRCS